MVAQMTASELNEVDVGSWFNQARPKLGKDEFAAQRVSTLDEVFGLFESRSRSLKTAKLYVEMKTEGARSSAAALARAAVNSILAHGCEHRAVLLSFDLRAIAEVKRLSGIVRTGALFQPTLVHPVRSIRRELMVFEAVNGGIDEIALHHRLVSKSTMALSEQYRLPVVVWTINTLNQMGRLTSLGVNAIITDNPALMKRL
jgi:glycerophosphoryl diester phosphodiesterase